MTTKDLMLCWLRQLPGHNMFEATSLAARLQYGIAGMDCFNILSTH